MISSSVCFLAICEMRTFHYVLRDHAAVFLEYFGSIFPGVSMQPRHFESRESPGAEVGVSCILSKLPLIGKSSSPAFR